MKDQFTNKIYLDKQILRNKKILFAIVDQANVRNKHTSLYAKMLDITRFYTYKFEAAFKCDIKVYDDIDASLQDCESYDLVVVQSVGNLLRGNVFFEYLHEYVENNPDFFILAFTLDWQTERATDWVEIHNQMLVINVHTWKNLNRPFFGGWEKVVEPLPNYSRSVENFHDRYTPFWIKGEPGYTELLRSRQGWNFLKTAFEAGIKIDNFTKDMRDQRLYLYPETDSERFWMAIQNKEIPSNMNPNQVKFLKSLSQPEKIWVYNSESYRFPFNTKGLQTYIGPCAGLKYLSVLEDNENVEFVFYDFSQFSISWQQHLRLNWNGREFGKFIKRQEHYKAAFKYINGSPEDNELIMLNEFSGPNNLQDLWQKFLKCNVTYIQADLFNKDSLKELSEKVNGKTLFYYSNIFATDYMIKHHMWSEIDQKYNEALGIFSQQPDVILYGTDSLSRWKTAKTT